MRTISLFIFSKARETSSVTCSTLSPLTISFIFGKGPRSLLAMASLSATALPITLRLAPQLRQYCKPGEDSVAHWGQYIVERILNDRFRTAQVLERTILKWSSVPPHASVPGFLRFRQPWGFWGLCHRFNSLRQSLRPLRLGGEYFSAN